MLCTYVCNIFDYISGVHLNEEKFCIIIYITKNGQKSSHNGFDLISLPLLQVGNHKTGFRSIYQFFHRCNCLINKLTIFFHNFLQGIISKLSGCQIFYCKIIHFQAIYETIIVVLVALRKTLQSLAPICTQLQIVIRMPNELILVHERGY